MYEWLLDHQQLIQDIDYLEYKLEREETELRRWEIGGGLGGRILHEKSISSGLEERIEKLKNDIKFKEGQLKRLLNLIDTFEGLENNIIKLKYIRGLTLEDVAEELNYSASHIKKKHAELVRTIKFVEKYHLGSLLN